MELIVTKVQRTSSYVDKGGSSSGIIADCIRIDWFMRFKIERNFFLFAFVGEDSTNKQHETIGRHAIVQFQALLCAGNGCQHRQSVYARLDVRSGSVLLRQHG